MVTLAQAQERAERWVNGSEVPPYQRREAHVREFELGFVAWAGSASPSERGPRLVIAKDSGDTTLWPGLPVDEVVAKYQEEYGATSEPAPKSQGAERLDLEATSFLLTPPDWLQQAADERGIPDRRTGDASPSESAPAAASDASAPASPPAPGAAASSGASPWEAADTSGSGGPAQQPPATVFAPPLAGSDVEESGSHSEARTELMPDGSALPGTAVNPSLEESDPPAGGGTGAAAASGSGGASGEEASIPPPGAPGTPGAASRSVPPGAGDIADADTSRATPGSVPSRSSRGSGPSVPPPPGAPGTPGARPGAGYVPTQLVSADDIAQSGSGQVKSEGSQGGSASQGGQSGGSEGGGVHHAATVLSDPSQGGVPAPPPPPGAPGTPGASQSGKSGSDGGGVHHAATVLANDSAAPAPPVPPPGAPGAPPAAPGQPAAQGQPGAPGQPPAPGAPAAPGAPPPGTAIRSSRPANRPSGPATWRCFATVRPTAPSSSSSVVRRPAPRTRSGSCCTSCTG